jgi:hypothetical protein
VFQWLDEPDVAEWLSFDRSHPWGPSRVSDLVPRGFDSYARIFHPLRVSGRRDTMSWRAVAELTGGRFHPLIQLDELRLASNHSTPELRVDSAGLSSAQWSALGEIVKRHTDSDGCVVAKWEGLGDLEEIARDPLLDLPYRRYHLAAIRIADWADPRILRGGAFMLWPADRSWILNDDVDASSCYVGGTRALVRAILASSSLEAAEATLGDPVRLS